MANLSSLNENNLGFLFQLVKPGKSNINRNIFIYIYIVYIQTNNMNIIRDINYITTAVVAPVY